MFWPLILLISIIPFGTAVQAIGTGIAFSAWCPALRHGLANVPRSLKGASVAAALTIGVLLLSTALNPANSSRDYLGYFLGHLGWIGLPLVAWLSLGPLDSTRRARLLKITGGILLAWGVLVASQSVWGWRLSGNEIIASDLRPRGLYSHPLSLAYALLWFWPAALDAALRPGRTRFGIAVGIIVALMLYWTESRTVQGVAVLLLVWSLATRLSGRARLIACGLFVLGLTVTFATDNRVSRKFLATFSDAGEDRESPYGDDRLAFWHAHGTMVQERPLLGHGINLNYTYRTPYYESLGLGHFKKKYEAHNAYLQLIAEGGFVAFACFAAWWLCVCHRIRMLANRDHARIAWQTLAVMGVAAMTQNAFQDFEARTVLTFAAVVLWLLPTKEPSREGSTSS